MTLTRDFTFNVPATPANKKSETDNLSDITLSLKKMKFDEKPAGFNTHNADMTFGDRLNTKAAKSGRPKVSEKPKLEDEV